LYQRKRPLQTDLPPKTVKNTITVINYIGRTGPPGLAAWHLPGGPVGPPDRWAATLNVEGGGGMGEVARVLSYGGGLSSDKLFAGAPTSLYPSLFIYLFYHIVHRVHHTIH